MQSNSFIPILIDASLPAIDTCFAKPFDITRYHDRADLLARSQKHEVLLCRSTLTVDATLLAKLPHLKVVATASSGSDHLDKAALAANNIAVFDAKGSNAHAVADYVLCVLASLSIHQGYAPKTAGIIGVGAVGSMVAKRLAALGMAITYYDPPRARSTHDIPHTDLAEVANCDLICVHANLHDDPPDASRGLLNAGFFSRLKPGTAIIQASRGDVVNEIDLLTTAPAIYYCADVFQHEPSPNRRIIDLAHIATPHIAGHAIEAKLAAVIYTQQHIYGHYGLSAPTLTPPSAEIHLSKANWPAEVLKQYDPMKDTLALKQAYDIENTFLSLRHNHQNRHHMNVECIFL